MADNEELLMRFNEELLMRFARILQPCGSWKYTKISEWECAYRKKADEWNEITPPVTDDRRLFINIFRLIKETLVSLPDNFPLWGRCTILDALTT